MKTPSQKELIPIIPSHGRVLVGAHTRLLILDGAIYYFGSI